MQNEARKGSEGGMTEADTGGKDEDRGEGPGLMGMLAMYGSDDEEEEQNDSDA